MPSMLEPEQDGHIDALIDVLIAIARRILAERGGTGGQADMFDQEVV